VIRRFDLPRVKEQAAPCGTGRFSQSARGAIDMGEDYGSQTAVSVTVVTSTW
jgi:hypothetical protein